MASAGNGDSKKATMNGFAIVGFGVLIVAGIFLAIYAARYVPETLSRLSSAVVLSSDQGTTTNEEEPGAEEETPAPPADTSDEDDADEEDKDDTPKTGGPYYVPQTPTYYPQQPNLYGRPDLVVINAEVGYFRGSSFVRDNDIPNNRDAAVTFSIQNRGTNVADGWRIRVDVEGERPVTGTGGRLMPNGTQNFTLRIENPEEGETIEIQIEADYEDDVTESNERNNDEELEIDVDN